MKIGQYLVTTWTNVCGLLFWATLYIERLNTYTVFVLQGRAAKGAARWGVRKESQAVLPREIFENLLSKSFLLVP